MSKNNQQYQRQQQGQQGQQQQQGKSNMSDQNTPPSAPVSQENATDNAAPKNVVVNEAPVVVQAKPTELPATASPSLMFFEQNLKEYAQKMGVGVPHPTDAGASYQAQFYHSILRLINNFDYDDFKIGFARLLEWAHANKDGQAAPHQLFRYTEHLAISSVDRDTCLAIFNMILIMANPTTRNTSAKTINWDKALGGMITEEGRNRISKFFGL